MRRRRFGGSRLAPPDRHAPYGGLLGAAVKECAPATGRHAIRVCITRPSRPGPVVSAPENVCALLRAAESADRESFYAIHLDSRNRVLGVEEIARGGVAQVAIHPREVFKGALLSNAAHIIMAHNHPSGDPTPSEQDRELTRRLVAAGKMIGVPITDHVVVGADGCRSIRSDSPQEFQGARRGRRRP